MNIRVSKILRYLIGWPLGLIAFIFILKIIAPQSSLILSNSSKLNVPLLLYGIVCFVAYYFLRALVWCQILEKHGYKIPFREISYLWSMSEMKRYVPGNLWSILGRAISFSEKGISKKDITLFYIIEAEILCIAAAIVSLFSLPFLIKNFFPFIPRFTVPITAIAVLGLVLGYIFNQYLFSKLKGKYIVVLKKIFPTISPFHIFTLLSIATTDLFFFGLGYYFTLTSFTILHPQLILEFIGFFVLSLIIGYLSFLTPAGFGVREGILIAGLSKYTSLANAGILSLFSRLILIISEVIFITLNIFLHKIHNKYLDKAFTWITLHKQESILIVFFVLYIVYFTTLSFLRYDNFYTGRFDLGNMAQTVWNTWRGRIFVFTNPNGTDIISRLAFHADFLLVLLAPFYYIWSDPKILLLIQTLVVGAGVFFVYFLAKDITKNKSIALAFSLLYILNPSIERANLYDFHPVTLAITFLLAAYYFVRRKQYWYFALFIVLAALTKEHVWVIVSLFGLYLLIIQRQKLVGTLVFLFSAGTFYFLVWYAIPHILGSQHFALSYYSDFGDTPSSVIKSMLLSPRKIIDLVTQHERLKYLEQLFLPLGYLSILSPLTLLFASPDLAINLLSNNSQLHQIYYQYTSTISPFLFIAAIYSVKIIKRYFSKTPNIILIIYLVGVSLYGAFAYGPLPGSKEPNLDMITRQVENKEYIDSYLTRIPKRYSVAASNNVGSHLSQRQRIYTVPLGINKADVIVFLLTDSEVLPSLKAEKQMVQRLKSDPNYYITVEQDKFIVFQKNGLKQITPKPKSKPKIQLPFPKVSFL